MMKFFLKLKAIWFFLSHWQDYPQECPPWTNDDRIALQAFYRTNTGRKLRMAMKVIEQKANREAVLMPDATHVYRGVACGWQLCLAWFLKLSIPDKEDLPARPLPLNGNKTSKPEQDEEALFAERYSP